MASVLRKLISSQALFLRCAVHARSLSVRPQVFSALNVRTLKTDSQLSSQTRTQEENKDAVKSDEDKSHIVLEMRGAVDQEAFATKYLEDLKGDDLEFLKLIQLEYYVMETEGVLLPAEENMDNKRWLTLHAVCPSRSSRAKIYRYWAKNDSATSKRNLEKAERRKRDEERREQVLEKQLSGEIGYSNRIFMRIYETTMNTHYYHNLFQAMQFGPKIIYDFSFEDSMAFREIKYALDQSVLAYAANKVHREPFHMIWTNVKEDSKVRKLLPKAVRDFDKKPFTVTEQNYLDMFPKEQLVWLSPNATETMKTYDPNLIYIVGGIVDTAGQPPLTFARAKKEGIKAYKLPVDHYLQWEMGSKSLTLDQVMKIMLEIKQSGNWRNALKHVPSRKIRFRLK